MAAIVTCVQIFEFAHGALQNSVTQIVKKYSAISLYGPVIPMEPSEGAEHVAFRLKIAAGAETAPFAGQDHDLDDGVARDLVTQSIELKAHERIDGVEFLGATQT